MPRTPAESAGADLKRWVEERWGNIWRGVHLFVSRRLRNRWDVEDAMQEILLRFLLQAPSGSMRDPSAYLYGIARYVVFEFYEVRKRTRSHVPLDEAAEERDAQSGPDASAELAQLRTNMEQAIATLPRDQQDFLRFHVWKGMTCEEAARASGRTPAMGEKVHAKARARLAVLMRDWRESEANGPASEKEVSRESSS